MRERIINIIILFACLGFNWIDNAFAQDPSFSQFYANPLYLNPAFAGSEICPRAGLSYRNQWPGYEASYITYNASYDQFIDALSGGVGLYILRDEAGEGDLSTTLVQSMYAYRFRLSRKINISSAIQAGWIQKKVDWSDANFGDMIDDRRGVIYYTQEQLNNPVKNSLDLSAGIVGYNDKYFLGLGVHHLLQPDESVLTTLSELPRKYSLHFGASIPVSSKGWPSVLSPNILIQRQNKFTEINTGMYFSKGPIVGGLWYRYSDAFIVLLGFKDDNFKIGYSYDMTVSSLTNKSLGSHELSFGYIFKCRPRKKRYNTINCPSF